MIHDYETLGQIMSQCSLVLYMCYKCDIISDGRIKEENCGITCLNCKRKVFCKNGMCKD